MSSAGDASHSNGVPPGPTDRPIRVLFVCTGNSARSLMAEALLRHLGGTAFEAASAGTDPKGVNPLTLRTLGGARIDGAGLASKSIAGYLEERFDYVVTLCDRARESCPVFHGADVSLHWGFDDPAEATGTEAERLAAFGRVMGEIGARIRLFIPTAMVDHGRTRDHPAPG